MKKILNKIKQIIIENKVFIISLIVLTVILNFELPYNVMTPGGTINVSERVSIDNKEINGSYNLLYVSEYRGTVMSLILATIFDKWDVESIEESKIGNESVEEINLRSKALLENSTQNAILVAFKELNQEYTIENARNIVIGILKDAKTDLKIGDIITSVDNIKINSIEEYKEIVQKQEVGKKLSLKVLRNNEEIDCYVTIYQKENMILTGLSIITNYDIITEPEIIFGFEESESGSSGGLMLALSIYDLLSDEDLLNGRNIAGTGAINENGEVEAIDGVKYKVIGAVNNKIDVIFVPDENYDEALKVKNKYKYNIIIVPVKTFTDAIDYLKKGE